MKIFKTKINFEEFNFYNDKLYEFKRTNLQYPSIPLQKNTLLFPIRAA
jgi:hypothetical protein